ncbi:MAG: YybH family protein [Gemmatimonadaceae bacterium]
MRLSGTSRVVRGATLLIIVTTVGALATPVKATAVARSEASVQTPSDSSDVVAVVRRYQAALATGDSAAALSLLAPDAVVLESGGVETREDYRAHHLPADIAFARAVPSERSDLRVAIRGDVGWVSSTSTTRGEFRGRQINSRGAELMVLSRESDGWKIRAIHWSSRSRPQ